MVLVYRPKFTGKIFEPLYQVESSDRKNTGGTGVGLSLTKELVTLHKGSISVTSETKQRDPSLQLPLAILKKTSTRNTAGNKNTGIYAAAR